jgi:tripartite-type tricarboxylate transporter receptor subunit TctC
MTLMKLSRRRDFLHLAASAAALQVFSRPASALDYPTRPVRIVVGFPAASGPDIVGRILGQQLSEQFRQQFIVENHPGASSSVAAQSVVNAAADGYTLLMGTGANTINATLSPNLSFDFVRDVSPVAIINITPFLLVTSLAAPARTISEFISYARTNPGRINVASAGVGSTNHLCLELLKMMTHVDLIHVPYRSSFVPDLLSGQVQSAFSTVPQVIENIKAGKLRAIGVTSATRVNVLADLPTIGETVPGYEADSWFGIVAPKGTPTEIVNALNGRINAIVAEPKVKIELEGLGVSPKSMTPIEFGKLIVDYTEKWAKVIKFAGIKAG